MAVSKIVWDGNTLTFPRKCTSWLMENKISAVTRYAADGHRRVHLRNYLWRVKYTVRGVLTQQEERDFWTWWAYAMRGDYFALAYDGDKTANTLLDAGAAAGQKVIPILATTDISAGDEILLTSATTRVFEVVEVDSVSAGVSITTTENLKNAFVLDDACRHLYYLPRCVSVGSRSPVRVEGAGSTNTLYFDHQVEEDLA